MSTAKLTPVRTTTLTRADVAVGEELPPLEVPVTTTLIATGAIASRDFHPVHHDRDRAQELGSPDIFMNIMVSNGLVGRLVTDWAGPDALLHAVRIRLGAPNYPGDTMRLTGKVTAVDGGDSGDRIVVEVAGVNRIGTHVSGTVELSLPE